MITKAEQRADAFVLRVKERIAATVEPERYEVEKKVTPPEYPSSATAVVVTIRDNKLDGALWVQWVSYEKTPNQARFLGGRQYATLFSKHSRIRKSAPHLWQSVNSFVWHLKEYDRVGIL